MPLPTVFLAPAHCFICEKCKSTNYIDAVPIEVTPEESEAYAVRYGGEAAEYVTGQLWEAPETVRCGNCGEEFEVRGSWFDGRRQENDD